MKKPETKSTESLVGSSGRRTQWLVPVLFAAILLSLFWGTLHPDLVLFSNDGPLGAQSMEALNFPAAWQGIWFDLNSLGISGDVPPPAINNFLRTLLSPLTFSRFFAQICLLILGCSAWLCFRWLGLSRPAAILGGLAAMLVSSYFTATAWGLGGQAIAIGMAFISLGLTARNHRPWLRLMLSGLAIGMAVVEGADIGALFSFCVAAWVVYSTAIQSQSLPKGIACGGAKVGVLAAMALLIAAQQLSVLVSTQVQGIAGAAQDQQTKAERWGWATQWSLPKKEALSLIVPGLFGLRMDTPGGGNYWGMVGSDPVWDDYLSGDRQGPPPQGFLRYVGGSNYLGVPVALVAIWAVFRALRRKDTLFTPLERKTLWFWGVVAVVSLFLAFGRFAPFYQFLYALPYFSTIRNPVKFLHILTFAIVVLFAYGVDGMWRAYFQSTASSASNLRGRLKKWWGTADQVDKGWIAACLVVLGVGLLAWLIYSSSRPSLEQYLQSVQFEANMAREIAGFSIRQVGWFILFFALAIGWMVLAFSRTFSGPKRRWGWILLGVLIVADLGRANAPFVIFWDYTQKYASNPVIDRLREKPYLYRVAIIPSWLHQAVGAPPEAQFLDQLYRIEWAQHHLLYYNIPSLDIVQMSRMPEDLSAFENALQPRNNAQIPHLLTRRWELTSTRYLFGPAEYVPLLLNAHIDPEKKRFRILERFNITPKTGIHQPQKLEELTAQLSTNGTYALIEFTGALPRAGLYTSWEIRTNGQALLERLVSPNFDPSTTVLLSEPLPENATSGSATNATQGNVEFAHYDPRNISLNANATVPSILMLNDRYDPNWNVYVDGEKKELLRPNFLMRGVFLQPGKHKVEFKFEPPAKLLFVNAVAWGVGLLLVIALIVLNRRGSSSENPQEPAKAAKA